MQDKCCLSRVACLVQTINAATVSRWHAGQPEPASWHDQEVCPAGGCSADHCRVLAQAHRKGEGSKARPSSMNPVQHAMQQKAWWNLAGLVPLAAVFNRYQCWHNNYCCTRDSMVFKSLCTLSCCGWRSPLCCLWISAGLQTAVLCCSNSMTACSRKCTLSRVA